VKVDGPFAATTGLIAATNIRWRELRRSRAAMRRAAEI
jgi:hypothetical protein